MHIFTRENLIFDVHDEGEGPAVVLLHGFPQSSAAWARVAPTLVSAGCRVLAPDLRGYSPGARPRARQAYRMSELRGDVLALLEQAGLERAHIVGHDWGGGLAWSFAQRHPERTESLTVLSTPHPQAMRWAFRNSDQGVRSGYMALMQLPALPELLLRQSLRLGALTAMGMPREQASEYGRRLLEPGALTGAVNWYRGLLAASGDGAGGADAAAPETITVPTTYVWGRRDPFLGAAAARRTEQFCTGDYRFVELEADHWLPEKQPRLVSAEILRRVHGG